MGGGNLFGQIAGGYGGGQIQQALAPAAAAKSLSTMDNLPFQRPNYNSLLDPTTGMIKSQYQTSWGSPITANQQGVDAIRDRALSTDASPWAKMALQKQGLEESGLNDKASANASGAQAGARSSLASKFGLSQGASERLATQGQRDLLSNKQDIARSGATARADIGLQDQNQKNSFLSQLPGLDFQNAGLAMQNRTDDIANQQYNIGNSVNENKYANDQALGAYNANMQAWAAQQNANAMRQSGSGGKK